MSTVEEKDSPRGRRNSPGRTDQFLPRRFSSRERSPYLVTDRITGYRSHSTDRELDDRPELSPESRITQPYRTSFSAVTSLHSPNQTRATRKPVVKNHAVAPDYSASGTFPRRGIRATLPDKVKSPMTKTQRSGSYDLLSSPNKENTVVTDNINHQSSQGKAASCDLLDGARSGNARPSQYSGFQTSRGSSPFENRRNDPKYSSTPASSRTFSTKPPVVRATESKENYSRLDSNESVFLPDSSQPKSSVSFENQPNEKITAESQGVDSDQTDSGFVEGKVEKRWLVEREYATNVVLTYADLKKMKKKNEFPQPNEETAALVEELKNEARVLRENRANSPLPAKSENQDGRLARSRWRTTINKKAHSITNFLRRIQSPRTSQNAASDKKSSKRSKSAGRLEGNRIHRRGSNNSISGRYEISTEGPSFSSDQSSSAFQSSSTPSEPMRSSDTESPSTPLKTSSIVTAERKVQVIVTDSPRSSAKNDASAPVSNLNSMSTRRILKSLEDNLGSGGTSHVVEKSVYQTFKEKQSPGYRRHAEALSMRTQALKAVEIPILSNNTNSGAPSIGGENVTGSPSQHDSIIANIPSPNNHSATGESTPDMTGQWRLPLNTIEECEEINHNGTEFRSDKYEHHLILSTTQRPSSWAFDERRHNPLFKSTPANFQPTNHTPVV